MVMMHSPVSDIPQPSASPRSSTPNSPNNSTKSGVETQFSKFEPIRIERPQPTKFDGIFRFHEQTDSLDIKNRPLIYPKDLTDLENSSKFSIERLKQLTNHSINRLSPSDDSNQSEKLTNDSHDGVIPTKNNTVDIEKGNNLHQINNLNQLNFHHPFPVKHSIPTIGINNNADVDIERFKLARNITNGRDLSDFGFRIQLSGLQTNYAHSDTSEELVVDENNESTQETTATTVRRAFFFVNENSTNFVK